MLYISKCFSFKKGLLFFLNPISIIITGYHNQFDNLAILLALLTISFYNEDEKFNKKDFGFVLAFSASLITKHILFIFPGFLFFRKQLPFKKKILYTFLPPFIFLLSFIPFIIGNTDAFTGVRDNVFLYFSFNNAPLLNFIYELFNTPRFIKLIIYILMMMILAIVTRIYTYEKQLLLYFIAMVAFSCAIANQYLAIPLVALCSLNTACFKYIYTIILGLYLVVQGEGLGLHVYFQTLSPVTKCIASFIEKRGYQLAAWILFATTLLIVISEKRKIRMTTNE